MTQETPEKPIVRGQLLATLRLIGASLLCLFGLLTIIEAPTDALWKPTIAITEAGHFFAIVPLCFLFGRLTLRRSRVAFGLALTALCLMLSPVVRAMLVSETIEAQVTTAFPDVTPLSREGAPARTAPFMVESLWQLTTPEVPIKRYIFDEANGLELDLYALRGSEAPRPLVVFVHGGGWSKGNSTQLPDVHHYLAARGYAVAAVNYRKAPAHPFPAAVSDVLKAIEFLKSRAGDLNIDATRIALSGRSAGAQLALVATYGTRDKAIKGVVNIYGATDLIWSWNNPANPLLIDSHQTLKDYIGGTPETHNRAYRAASPMDLVHNRVPPTLLLHGARDGIVSLPQSQRLATRLKKLGAAYTFIGLGWGTHGFDANLYGPSGQIYLYALERFLAQVLK